MKASTETKPTLKPLEQKNLLAGIFLHIGIFLCGIFLSLAPILGSMFPFGAALVSSVKRKYLSSATAGSILGYILNSSGGFIYIAAIAALVAIRVILGDKSRVVRSAVFASLITFFTVGIIGIAAAASYGGSFLLRFGEAAIAGVAAYFITIVSRIQLEKTSGLDIQEMVSAVFVISILLLSLYNYNILGLSVGRILSVVIILFAARFGRSSYGAVCGTIISFILAISGSKYFEQSSIFAFSGLMCGLFARLGSLGIISAYIGTTLVSSLITAEYEALSIFFFEAVIGSGLFLLIPRKLGGSLGGVLAPPAEMTRMDSVKNSLIMRLEFAGGALRDVYETVEDVALKLKEINNPDFEKTLHKIEDDVCNGCSLRKHCWETAKDLTAADALQTWNKIKYPDHTLDEEKENSHNCLRQQKFIKSVSRHCAEYDTKKAAESRLSEVRGVISDQFEGISNMLFDLSTEFQYEVRHDSAAAENIILTMKNLGFHAVNCIAARDKFGRLSADIHIMGTADKTINKMEIMRNLSLAVGRDFDIPSVNVGGDEAFIFITEKPVYKIEIGISQIPESKGKLCGDSYKYFTDGRGRFIMLISDGMGTGGRAAVDSAMVSGLMSRMIRSGFGYDCALKIVNSSMLFKSTDESLSTVDISAIDLFTGECELLKAGAAPTYVRRLGKVGKAESNSLPPGILRNISLDKAKINLKAEDIIVMVSDGATCEGDQWICEIIGDWTIGSAQQLADEIAFAARRRRSDGHNDDITVMAAILKK